MNKPLYNYFTSDHRRIEALLDKAIENPEDVVLDYYHQFRTGLLRHIKMEEKVLFPAARKANDDVPLPLAAKLRLDHGALTSLMVVPPSADVIKVLLHVLETHDELEEEQGGMYDACEALTAGETEALIEKAKAVTEVPVRPFNEDDFALEVAKRSLQRAGFDFDAIVEAKGSL